MFKSTALSNYINYGMFISGFHHQIMSGSLIRLDYLKLRSMAHVSLFECNFCSLRNSLKFIFKANYIRCTILISGGHFIRRGGTVLAVLIEGHLRNIPMFFE